MMPIPPIERPLRWPSPERCGRHFSRLHPPSDIYRVLEAFPESPCAFDAEVHIILTEPIWVKPMPVAQEASVVNGVCVKGVLSNYRNIKHSPFSHSLECLFHGGGQFEGAH